jgi:Methyltransferase small domain
MSGMTSSAGMPPVLDLPLIDLLREDLRESGFTVGGVEDAVGPVAAAALHREQATPALRVTTPSATSEPRLVLTRLFVLGQAVPSAFLDDALPRVGAAGAARLGLVGFVGEDGSSVEPLLDLRPYSATDAAGPVDWWLASDLGELATGERLSGDHVLGAGGASVTLAQVTMRTPRHRVLDVGTGCGIQALHASRHADCVVATDLSQRALHFAAFNAALDGVHLDLRAGSMLEPVAGETFDLVVSNPPFVITPRLRAADGEALPTYEYRDAGLSGDDLIRDLVTGVGTVLAPGGVAQMLGNWEHRRGEPWTERVGRWLVESGLDGWVIQREVLDPAEYAETWIRDGGTTPEREPELWARAYSQWLDDFASRDVEAIGFGIIVLRRPADRTSVSLRRLEEHTASVRQPLGPHLAACLAAHDWLAVHDDAALAATHLSAALDVTEERFYTPGAADPNIVIIRQGDGLGRGVQSSTSLSALVGACDGELTVGQIIAAIASIFEVSATDLTAELLPAVRSLIRDGFLLVV